MSYFDDLRALRNTERGKPRPAVGASGRRRIVSDIAPPKPRSARIPASAPRSAATPVSREIPKPGERRSGSETESALQPAPQKRVLTPSQEAGRHVIKDLDLPIRTWEPERLRRNRRLRTIAVLGGGAMLIVGAVFVTFVTPRFSVTINPKVERLAAPPTELIADTAITSVDVPRHRLPGMRVEVERRATGEFTSSGTKFFQDRARGTVSIYNSFSSSPQPLVANTRLQDANGKIFRLTSAVVVPGARVEGGKISPTSIQAAVLADEPGDSYNIGPAEFRIPGFRGTARYDGFSARSDEAFLGGFEGQARTVTATDLSQASQELTKRLVEEIVAELKSKIPSDADFILPDGGREVEVLAVEGPGVGARFERFSMEVTGRGKMVIVRRAHALEALKGLLVKPGSGGLEPTVASESSDIGFSQGRSTAAGELRFVTGGTLAYWFKPELDELLATLRTSTPRKAEAYLRSREEIASFTVRRFPRWLWFIPAEYAM